jgi:carbon storage regulator
MTAAIQPSTKSFRKKRKRGEPMLVLTRKTGESIQIGDHIELTVLSIKGDQIKIGINAPKNIDIHRKEIYLDIKGENENASKAINLASISFPKS